MSGIGLIEVRARNAEGIIEWSASVPDAGGPAAMRDAQNYANIYPESTIEVRRRPHLGRWGRWKKVNGYE